MTCLINLIEEGVKDSSVMEERRTGLWTSHMVGS